MSCDHIEYSLYKVFDFELVFICETSIFTSDGQYDLGPIWNPFNEVLLVAQNPVVPEKSSMVARNQYDTTTWLDAFHKMFIFYKSTY